MQPLHLAWRSLLPPPVRLRTPRPGTLGPRRLCKVGGGQQFRVRVSATYAREATRAPGFEFQIDPAVRRKESSWSDSQALSRPPLLCAMRDDQFWPEAVYTSGRPIHTARFAGTNARIGDLHFTSSISDLLGRPCPSGVVR